MFESPKSFRMREISRLALNALSHRDLLSQASPDAQYPVWQALTNSTMDALASHDSHPDFLNLAGLVSEAVLEVVFVALPGFFVAISGMFDANAQKMVAELNTMVFTPCLIFTKLAGQLSADKLGDLVVIPFIFVAQTFISWLCAQILARAFGFGGKQKTMQRNFVLAMAVFGNSNSLPMSLVLSLSKTISGLHWDQVPGDNDGEVAARGILYLLIFQQLGQLLRWTWGYSVLLKPASGYKRDERDEDEDASRDRGIEEGPYRDDPEQHANKHSTIGGSDSGFSSGSQTPELVGRRHREIDTRDLLIAPANGNNVSTDPHTLVDSTHSDTFSERSVPNLPDDSDESNPVGDVQSGWKTPLYRVKNSVTRCFRRIRNTLSTFGQNLFRSLPLFMQRTLSVTYSYGRGFLAGVWRQMNPPLWAMLAALIVASVPQLQAAFFTKGTFLNNSVTRAISQSGGVAVPLILVVLGANLARSTIPQDQLATSPEAKKEERKLLFASLLSRMVFPVVFMAPLLALTAKYVPVSILDDPIFIVVCFLLTGAPSALQLAQICQINNVFMGAMSNLLVASYVVVIFPSTLVLVLMALEVLEWTALS